MFVVNLINNIMVKKMVSKEYDNPIDLFLEMDKFIKEHHAYSSKDEESKNNNFTIKDKRFDEFKFTYKGKKLPFKTVYGYWELMNTGLTSSEPIHSLHATRIGKDLYDFETILDIIANDFLIDYKDFYNTIRITKYGFISNLTGLFLVLNRTWTLYHRTMIGDDLLEELRMLLTKNKDYESLSDMLVTFLNCHMELFRAADKELVTKILATLVANNQRKLLVEILENSFLFFEDTKRCSELKKENFELLFRGLLYENEEDNLIDVEMEGVYLELYSSFITKEDNNGMGCEFEHKELLYILTREIIASNNETAKTNAIISFWHYLNDYDKVVLLRDVLKSGNQESINKILSLIGNEIEKPSIKRELGEEGLKLIHKRS